MERREFLKIASVGATTAAVGCSPKATEKLIPYLVPAEEIVPGVATWYATVSAETPAAPGIQVKTREGRPILIQGNPEHPLSGGAVDAITQSALQSLYDPDRVRTPAIRSSPERFRELDWNRAERLLAQRLTAAGGQGVYFVSGQITGTLDGLVDRWLAAFGSTNRVTYEPYAYEPLLAANRLVFGQEALPLYDLARARYLISFGADFLETWIAPTFFARGFTALHAFRDGRMGKFVHVEPRLSLTAANADEWIAPRPGTEMLVALALANAIAGDGGGVGGVQLAGFSPEAVAERTDVPADTIRRIAREFRENAPSLALAGGVAATHRRATETCAAVNVLNQVAGNVGQTLRFGPNFQVARTRSYAAIEELVTRMRAGRVQVLLVHGANPVFTLPPGLGFADAMRNVPFKVSLSTHYDETAALADLLLPTSHSLESWGDAEAVDGVRGLMQPVVAPLHRTRMLGDILLGSARAAGVAGLGAESFEAYLREAWTGRVSVTPATAGQVVPGGAAVAALEEAPAGELAGPGAAAQGGAVPGAQAGASLGGALDTSWNDALRRGGAFAPAAAAAPGTEAGTPGAFPGEAPGTPARPAASFGAPAAGDLAGPAEGAVRAADTGQLRFEPADFDGDDGLFLMVFPTVAFYDGRGANRPWMQELPDPVTKAVWGSWVEIHPETARELGIAQGDLVRVTSPHGALDVPAFLYPGIRRDTVAVPIGQGHTEYGRFAKRKGANPIALLPPGADSVSGGRTWFATRVKLELAGPPPRALSRFPPQTVDRLITLQGSPHQHSRGIALALSLPEARGAETRPEESESARLMEAIVADAAPESPYRWGMAIDLAKCTGCSACVTACYMENNIGVVGPDDCEKGRELAWLRIERYWEEPAEPGGGLQVRHLPMLCQHCGQAPCEPVCPVYAAYHTPEGLNAQVYNRCVGTRYCSNNCPYKVRKFGFFAHPTPSPLNLQFNPDVTVRDKGVMEKCTFCVQRIREGKIHAKGEGRALRDGEVVTACQAACPAQAITFGNLRDPESRVYREAMSGRGYSVLASLNTRSAITYLAEVVHTDRPLGGSAGHGERGPSHGPETPEAERRGGKRGAAVGTEGEPLPAEGAH